VLHNKKYNSVTDFIYVRREKQRVIEQEIKKKEREDSERDHAYRERLRSWEKHERNKQRDLKENAERDAERTLRREKARERILSVIENPQEELKSDFHRDRERWSRERRKERDRELEADDRDRRRERDEQEQLKFRVAEEERRKAEEERRKVEDERRRIEAAEAAARQLAEEQALAAAQAVPYGADAPRVFKTTVVANKEVKKRAGEVFNDGDDEANDDQLRKRRNIVPIEYTKEEMMAAGVDVEELERKQKVMPPLLF